MNNLNQYVANHHLFFAYFHLNCRIFLKFINDNFRLIPSGETKIQNSDIHGSYRQATFLKSIVGK
jgi:hypothetical protein